MLTFCIALVKYYVSLFGCAGLSGGQSVSKESAKLDQAARAAWLSWVGGLTQDEIATRMGISRQTAQRLTAQAMTAGIVKVRIEHPLAESLDLGAQLQHRFGLRFAEVTPEDAGASGVAMQVAELLESQLNRTDPMVLALGTGRTLRAGVAQMAPINCPQHRIVSLTGNIAPDGSTSYYNVLFSLSERVTAHCYPLMLPVIAATPEERDTLQRQPGNERALTLAANADTAIIGIGDLGPNAPLQADGFLTREEITDLNARGAVGEVIGIAFDVDGHFLPRDGRVASAELPDTARALVIAAVHGASKRAAALGALRGGFINGLICDAATARWLLDQPLRRAGAPSSP